MTGENEKGGESTRFDKIMSRKPKAYLSAIKLPNKSYSVISEEILNHLIENHFLSFSKRGKTCGGASDSNGNGKRCYHYRGQDQMGS